MLKHVVNIFTTVFKWIRKNQELHTAMTVSKFSDVKCTSLLTADQSSSFGFSGGLLGFFMKPTKPFLLFSPSYINFMFPFLQNRVLTYEAELILRSCILWNLSGNSQQF
jgi:hypothetical protein